MEKSCKTCEFNFDGICQDTEMFMDMENRL